MIGCSPYLSGMAPPVRASVAPADLTMEDSAWPFPAGQEPPADCVLIYGPGDTPHTWTPSDIAEQTARYRLPGFVRSNPAGASYIQDANAFTIWLKQIGAPVGCATFLDLETAISPGYVSAFGHIMNLEGYKVLPYGSIAYVWQNPHLDGLFVAHYTEAPHLCTPAVCGFGLNANALISQYQNTPAADFSLIDPSVPLWDTHLATQEFLMALSDAQQTELYNAVLALAPSFQPNGSAYDAQVHIAEGLQANLQSWLTTEFTAGGGLYNQMVSIAEGAVQKVLAGISLPAVDAAAVATAVAPAVVSALAAALAK